MTYRVVNTDNLGGDYPNERFVGPEYQTREQAQDAADTLNGPHPEHSMRYHMVVELPYELQLGFEP